MKSTPAQFFKNTILVHESSKHSLDPDDKGNWHRGQLVGSKYGVTGDALAKYRGVLSVTKADMAKLTEKEAIDLGLAGYYRTNGLDTLPWDAVIASVVDLGFNAGPKRAVEVFQQMLNARPDGQAGPMTRGVYETWLKGKTPELAMRLWTVARLGYYQSLHNPKYIGGWTNRANSFMPGTEWWKANV